MKDLLHIPVITKNLMSVSMFAQDTNFCFEFYANSCYVENQDIKEIILKGVLKDELYFFLNFPLHSVNLKSIDSLSSLGTWHSRLGYAFFQIVKKISNLCKISQE